MTLDRPGFGVLVELKRPACDDRKEAVSDIQKLLEGYIACWNETDATRRRDLIRRTFTEEASYIDPLMEGHGHEGLDATIAGTQQQFPGYAFALLGEGDSYGNRVRFSWVLGPSAQPDVIVGTDFAVVREGRLHEVTGFLDKLPGRAVQGA